MILAIDDPTFIASVEKGIPIGDLEKRLRPALYASGQREKDVDAHAAYWDFSRAGFIGPNESLLETIYKDWQTVDSYGVKHEEIAAALYLLISVGDAEVERIRGSWRSFPYKILPKSVRRLVGLHSRIDDSHNCRPLLKDGYNYFLATPSSGPQSCPWGCDGGGFNAGVIHKGALTQELFEEFLLAHSGGVKPQERRARIIDGEVARTVERVAETQRTRQEPYYAPLTNLLPHMIEKHYFFEGVGSPYRADPAFLI